jgi:hypothetical protein
MGKTPEENRAEFRRRTRTSRINRVLNEKR